MSRERQQRQQGEMREQILNTAREIITNEGMEALSIRRISKAIEYSPGNIYYYFKDKHEIVLNLIFEGYGKIIAAIEPTSKDLAPDASIRVSFTNYIHSALQWADEYKAFMFSSEPEILMHTSILNAGSTENRKALHLLCEAIEAGISNGLFASCDVELTAQSLWCSMFGLLARLIIEKDVSEEQKNKLIERQMDILLNGLR